MYIKLIKFSVALKDQKCILTLNNILNKGWVNSKYMPKIESS